MNRGFWDNLPRPFFALAPMYDVTDTAFRQVIAALGKPDVFFTEFVSVDGLAHPASRQKLVQRYLQYEEVERPIVAQIWGHDPKKFHAAATLIRELGFDGVDINMGCPEKKIVKHGSCAALIAKPELAREIIAATREGAESLLVSVKTRLGLDTNSIDTWVPQLLKAGPAAITIHGRTAKEMSKVPAHWDEIGRAVELARGSGTLIIGNGDVQTREEALEKADRYGVDGVMVGRGIFHNLWFFNPAVDVRNVSVAERLELMLRHVRLFNHYFRGLKNFAMMRKHFQNYVQEFAGAQELRHALMQTKTFEEVEAVVNRWRA